MNAQMFWKKNGSTILTVAGATGLVATTVLAVKATPKALKKIEDVESEKGERLSKWATIKVAGSVYVPTVLVGAGTLACIFGANVLSQRQQASLASAYALLDTSFKDYKRKLIELHGEETHQEVVDAIAIEKAQDDWIIQSGFFGEVANLGVDADSEPRLFYDEHSGRYFEATIERVLQAEYHLNRNYILRGFAYLNEFYDLLGIEETDYGSVQGWCPNDNDEFWIEFNHRKVLIDDDLECYIIDMPLAPKYDFWDC